VEGDGRSVIRPPAFGDSQLLKSLAAETVLAAMTNGSMAEKASHLSGAERRALAEFITGKSRVLATVD
jgi:hypothetical protein